MRAPEKGRLKRGKRAVSCSEAPALAHVLAPGGGGRLFLGKLTETGLSGVLPRAMRFDTLAIHAGQQPEPTTGAIMTPVFLSSTYVQAGPGEHKGYE